MTPTATLTTADIDALEPLLATALRPLPDALDHAMRALAMARTVADGAQVVDQPSSDTDATSEPAAAECEDAGAPVVDQPPQYPGVAWCACRPTPRYAQRQSGSWGHLWYAGGWTIRGYPKGKCGSCGTALEDANAEEADHAAE